jgi:hypothetical protein
VGGRRVPGSESARVWAKMGRGRGKRAILAAAGGLWLGLLGTGCGAESHPNNPRPPVPVEVTVNITDRAVQAQPAAVGVKRSNAGALAQNVGKEQGANAKEPLVVNFTTSNTTATDTTLEIHGPVDKRSGPIVAEGNNVLKVALPSGRYRLEAADLPGAKQAPFYVGPARVSSQNELLLP